MRPHAFLGPYHILFLREEPSGRSRVLGQFHSILHRLPIINAFSVDKGV